MNVEHFCYKMKKFETGKVATLFSLPINLKGFRTTIVYAYVQVLSAITNVYGLL